jgi:SHS2 domain-containing protein
MRYKFVDHMADIEFVAYGKTEEELFTNSLAALFETSADTSAISKSQDKRVRVTVKEKADTLEELLWYTLQHTLSITESRRIFAYEVADIVVDKEEGKFVCALKVFAKEKRDEYSKLAVKGISQYGLKIRPGEVMEASVIVDV